MMFNQPSVLFNTEKTGFPPQPTVPLFSRLRKNTQKPARHDDIVYESLSVKVEAGKTLALVDPSGGGKSTITKLLLHLYEPTSGLVTLDGMEIKNLNVGWYRDQVGSPHLAVTGHFVVLVHG